MKIEFWIAFAVYFSLLFAIALSVRKKHATSADLLVGGRKLNFWVTALSAQASDMSSWLFMAFPMSIYLGGLPQLWIAVSLVAGMFCTWHFVAPQLRVMTEKYNCFTLSGLFAKVYGDPKGHIRILSASLLLLFTTYYLSAGLISCGFLFGSLFEMDYFVGITIATVVMMAYTFIGGFISVAWADLFQALFLLGAITVVPLLAFIEVGGAAPISFAAEQAQIPLGLGGTLEEILFPLLGWGLGYFGMPHILVKFLGIKNAADLRKSKYLGISWQIIVLIAAACVGIISVAYFKNGISNPELVFVEMCKQLFYPLVAGFVLCGLLAAMISTMDSQILVCASSLTEDIYKYFVPKMKDGREVKVFRLSVVVVSFIAFAIALGQNSTIMETVYYAWSGLGCSFGPLLLVTIYSKKATSQGAIAGILTGGLTAAFWPTINKLLLSEIGPIPSMIIGFPLSLVMIFVVSKMVRSRVKKSIELSPQHPIQ